MLRERIRTIGRVAVGLVVLKCTKTAGGVAAAGCVAKERISAVGRVELIGLPAPFLSELARNLTGLAGQVLMKLSGEGVMSVFLARRCCEADDGRPSKWIIVGCLRCS
jgi:hypothetical protein